MKSEQIKLQEEMKALKNKNQMMQGKLDKDAEEQAKLKRQ